VSKNIQGHQACNGTARAESSFYDQIPEFIRMTDTLLALTAMSAWFGILTVLAARELK
jgi:hypothetical protein